MSTSRNRLDQSVTPSPRRRLRWLREAGGRSRATLDHIRITGQLGPIEDPERFRRTGIRF